MAAPEHQKITPEEAARLIVEFDEVYAEEGQSEEDVARQVKDEVEEFGPLEAEIDGVIYTVETEDADPYVPDLEAWAGKLARDIGRTPTDYQGHPDVPEDAALALVEALEPEDLDRLADALLEAAPGLAGRFIDVLLGDLKEELHERGLVDAARAVSEVQAHWEQDA